MSLTPSASAEPFGSTFDAAKVVDGNTQTGWAINTAAVNGSWWLATWDAPVAATGVDLRARDSSNASPGTDENPTSTVLLSDSTSVDLAGVGVNGTLNVDFGGLKTFTTLKVTFTAAAPFGGNPGWSVMALTGEEEPPAGGTPSFMAVVIG